MSGYGNSWTPFGSHAWSTPEIATVLSPRAAHAFKNESDAPLFTLSRPDREPAPKPPMVQAARPAPSMARYVPICSHEKLAEGDGKDRAGFVNDTTLRQRAAQDTQAYVVSACSSCEFRLLAFFLFFSRLNSSSLRSCSFINSGYVAVLVGQPQSANCFPPGAMLLLAAVVPVPAASSPL